MGKITRLGDASHVTTIVGETGEPEVEELVPESQQNTEVVVDDQEFEPEDDEVVEGTFEATGEAEVIVAEQPPVEKKADDVKAWVGDDYVKAERALEAERNGQNRTGLVQWLEKVAAAR